MYFQVLLNTDQSSKHQTLHKYNYVELHVDIIGHFRISLSLFLKASLGAHPFI